MNRAAVSAYSTTLRRVAAVAICSVAYRNSNNTVTARNELDSHADTCALGSNFVPLHYTGRVCDVSPYNSTYDPERDIPIVTGATAYTDPHTGQVFILVINEALWFGERLSNSLINPNQLRYAGVLVQDNPFITSEPIAIKHEEVNVPLLLDGTNLFFQTTTPTQSELDNCPHIELTFDSEWNPHTVQLAAVQSTAAADAFGNEFGGMEPGLLQISSIYSFREMTENMRDQRNVCAIDVAERKTFVSKDCHPAVTKETLSERWNIGLNQAKQTLRVTTQ